MAKRINLIKPNFKKLTEEEKDILIGLRDTAAWDIFKRVASRYVDTMKESAFAIPYTEPRFLEKHAELIGHVFGIQEMINLVEDLKEK